MAAATAHNGMPSKRSGNPTPLSSKSALFRNVSTSFRFMVDIIRSQVILVNQEAAHVAVIKYGNTANIAFMLDTYVHGWAKVHIPYSLL